MTSEEGSGGGGGFEVDDVMPEGSEGFVFKALLSVVLVLAVYFALRFYWSLVSFLQTWLSREYVDLFEAFVNLALLLLLAAGFVWLMKRRSSS